MKFVEYSEICNTIKSYSLNIFKGGMSIPVNSSHNTLIRGRIYKPVIENEETLHTAQEKIYEERTMGSHSVNRGCRLNKILVYNVNGYMTKARLTTDWGMGYLYLFKVNRNWTIFNVL